MSEVPPPENPYAATAAQPMNPSDERLWAMLTHIGAIVALFIGLPWLVLHYLTRWRTAATLTREDENVRDELYELARRLEDRMTTIERIIAADDPNWKKGA